ncbi:uncharacterized protein EI97DRAFT_429122 [Westerdykella ornata]|uniref:Uncharacterized protein n=1 Tax=Westerdykella ornata TaxID=318751 RepID=A0A6A6JWP6_WESOR|nr:uncharacterized protein EI97DRAFT_429122 [Westerdykella ornata]KAF2281040.1 hypothetical protein EI97DRAFT_429122 [Westerdykella ornata]
MSSRTSIGKVFLAGGVVGLGYYAYMRQYWFPKTSKTEPNPFRTQGVKNIEDRYTAGGGMPNHQPGTATKAGDSSNVETRQQGVSKGPDSAEFAGKINDQKTEEGAFPDKFYQAQYGNPKGK